MAVIYLLLLLVSGSLCLIKKVRRAEYVSAMIWLGGVVLWNFSMDLLTAESEMKVPIPTAGVLLLPVIFVQTLIANIVGYFRGA